MSDAKSKRTDIYPYNVEKANQLSKALNMSDTEMVNYLIDVVTVEQLTKITFTDPKTKRSAVILKQTNKYDPNGWRG